MVYYSLGWACWKGFLEGGVIPQKATFPSLTNTIWNELMQPSSFEQNPLPKQVHSFPSCKVVIGCRCEKKEVDSSLWQAISPLHSHVFAHMNVFLDYICVPAVFIFLCPILHDHDSTSCYLKAIVQRDPKDAQFPFKRWQRVAWWIITCTNHSCSWSSEEKR